MDTADTLRVIYELSLRTLRGHREQQKTNEQHQNLQEAFQQATLELEGAVNLADCLYETNQRMGTVIDYLLKERGATVPSGESDSFDIVLNRVLSQLEGIEGNQTGGAQSPIPAGDVTMTENPASPGDSSRATREQLLGRSGPGQEGEETTPLSPAERQ